MAVENPFTVLPREIRDMIYIYAIQDIKCTNILAHKTAYNRQNAPILYINDAIANDFTHLLYKDHEIVAHITEPRYSGNVPRSFLSDFRQCSRLMKQRSHTFVVEVARPCSLLLSPLGHRFPDTEEYTPRESLVLDFDESGTFRRRIFAELEAVKPELANLQKLDVSHWLMEWYMRNLDDVRILGDYMESGVELFLSVT